MNKEEQLTLMTGLATSPDFILAFLECAKNTRDSDSTLHEIGLWFFSMGYISCLEFMTQEKMTRPFKYEPPKEQI